MNVRLGKIIVLLSLSFSILLYPNGDLFSADRSDWLLISGSFGIFNPMGDIADECESGKALGISLQKGAYRLSFIESKHDGKEDEEDVEYTITRVVFSPNLVFHNGSQLFISGGVQMELVIDEPEFEDNYGSAFFLGIGAGIEFYIQKWLSIGPRIVISSNAAMASAGESTKTARFLDLSALITIHL